MAITWKSELNRLATEFWFRAGDATEVTPWVGAAYEAGETAVELAELWGCLDVERARSHLQVLAKRINGFEPWSAAALPLAAAALKRELRRYLARETSPSALCRLVELLDVAFLDKPPPPNLDAWMGNLWNSCDWCDATWTFENTPNLEVEAKAVLAKLEFTRL